MNLYFTDKDMAYIQYSSSYLPTILSYGPFENVYLNIDKDNFENSQITQSNCIYKYAAINQAIQYYTSLVDIVEKDSDFINKFWTLYNQVIPEVQTKYQNLYYVEKKISAEEAYAYIANDVFDYMIEQGMPEKHELTREDFGRLQEILDIELCEDLAGISGSPDVVYPIYKQRYDRSYEDAFFYFNNPDVVKVSDFKPSINDCSAQEEIKYGESATYTVSPPASAQEYQWYINGEYFTSGDSCTVDTPTENYTISVTAVYPNGYSESSDITAVTVKEPTFLDKVEAFFNTIIIAVVNFFKKIFG